MSDFFLGLKAFTGSVSLLFRDKEVGAWFKSLTLISFAISLVILVLCMAGGAYTIAALGNHWLADIGAVVWVIGLLFFSGTICMLVMSMVVSLFGQEERLMRALRQDAELLLGKARFKHVRKEWMATVVSAVVTVFVWPFYFIPFLIPIAVLALAWAFGREALIASYRIRSQVAEQGEFQKGTAMYRMGLGLGPAFLSLFPVLGWSMWPLLLLSALRGQEEMMLRRIDGTSSSS